MHIGIFKFGCKDTIIIAFITIFIAMTKERILKFIEVKNITPAIFLKMTGIKRGFLDSDKLGQAVSDKHFAMIIAAYPDINLYWLITGEGDILREKGEKRTAGGGAFCEIPADAWRVIGLQAESLKEKDEQITRLIEMLGVNDKHISDIKVSD